MTQGKNAGISSYGCPDNLLVSKLFFRLCLGLVLPKNQQIDKTFYSVFFF